MSSDLGKVNQTIEKQGITDEAAPLPAAPVDVNPYHTTIEKQGILEEAAHLGGRIAGAAKNTAVAAKDTVVNAAEYTKEKAVAAKDTVVNAAEYTKEKAIAAGEFTKEKAVAAKDFLVGGPTTEHVPTRDVFGESDTLKTEQLIGEGVKDHTTMEKKHVMNQEFHESFDKGGVSGVLGGEHLGFGHESKVLGREFETRDLLGADTAKTEKLIGDGVKDHDTMEKKHVMNQEFQESMGGGLHDDKVIGANFGQKELGEGLGTEFHGFRDTTPGDKRTVLGERTDTLKTKFDNAANTVSEKAGQLKDSALEKGGHLKDAAWEKGVQLKDAAMDKAGQLKDGAMEKGGQLKDAAVDKAHHLREDAVDKGYQLKDAAVDKGLQLKDSAADSVDQLKGKAADAGHAIQEKGHSLKRAHDKGFADQEARADKENVQF